MLWKWDEKVRVACIMKDGRAVRVVDIGSQIFVFEETIRPALHATSR